MAAVILTSSRISYRRATFCVLSGLMNPLRLIQLTLAPTAKSTSSTPPVMFS